MAEDLWPKEATNSIAEEMKREQQSRDLRSAAAGAVGVNPDEYSRAKALSKDVGLSPDVVMRNPEIAKKKQAEDLTGQVLFDVPTEAHPWLVKNIKTVSDDVSMIGKIKDTITKIPEAYGYGDYDVEKNQIANKKLSGLPLTPEEGARYAFLKQQVKNADYGDSAVLSAAFTAPQLVDQAVKSGKGATLGGYAGVVAGGVGGFAVGGPPGAAAGMIGGGAQGARIGGTAANITTNWVQQSGSIYAELEDVQNEKGERLDPNVIRGAAMIVGGANGVLDLLPFDKFIRTIPGVDDTIKRLGGKALTKEGIKEALKNPALQRAFYAVGKRWAAAATTEGAIEGAQQTLQILGTEVAKGLSDAEFEPISWGEAAGQVYDATKMGLQVGGILTAPSSAASIPGEIKRQRRYTPEQIKAHVEGINKAVPAEKLFQRDRDGFRDLVNTLAPGEKFWIDGQAAQQAIGAMAPEEQAALMKAVPSLAEELRAANEEGGYVSMTKADYATFIAPTPGAAALADHMKVDLKDMSMAERMANDELMKSDPELATRLMQMDQAPDTKQIADAVERVVRKAMVAAGRPNTEARMNATLMGKMYSRFAGAMKMSATDFLQQYVAFQQLGRDGQQLSLGSTTEIMLAEYQAMKAGKAVPGLNEQGRAALVDFGSRMEAAGLAPEQLIKMAPEALWEALYNATATGGPDAASMDPNAVLGQLSGQMGQISANLSAATQSIPGLREMLERAAADPASSAALQYIASNALKVLTSGLRSVTINETPSTGLYGGIVEPSLGLDIQFDEAERPAVLAALAQFADNFNQEQVHVRGAAEGPVGTRNPDGSFNTAVFTIPLARTLTREEADNIIAESGLQGLTFSDNEVEIYYAQDPEDQAAIAGFIESARRATDAILALGAGRGGAEVSTEKLWIYGDGQGAIPFNQIEGDVQAETPGADPNTKLIAERYFGGALNFAQQPAFAKGQPDGIAPDQAQRQRIIAEEFAALPYSDMDNPLVRQAYEELARETIEQYRSLPLKEVEALVRRNEDGTVAYDEKGDVITEGEPYKNSEAMRRDVSVRNRMKFYPTTKNSFGPEGSDWSGHPLLADTEFRDKNGYPMVVNDLFRVIHDYYAHTGSKASFGPLGEETAWKNHMATIRSPWARWALTSETRGQNSWVNFNREVWGKDVPITDRKFSAQKAALLPLDTVLTGDATVDAPVTELMATLTPEQQMGSLKERVTADMLPPVDTQLNQSTRPTDVDAMGFFSQMRRVLDAQLNPTGTAKQYLEQIRAWAKGGKFKQDELYWSGIEEALESTEVTDKITKDDVLRLFDNKRVEVNEEVLSEDAVEEDDRPTWDDVHFSREYKAEIDNDWLREEANAQREMFDEEFPSPEYAVGTWAADYLEIEESADGVKTYFWNENAVQQEMRDRAKNNWDDFADRRVDVEIRGTRDSYTFSWNTEANTWRVLDSDGDELDSGTSTGRRPDPETDAQDALRDYLYENDIIRYDDEYRDTGDQTQFKEYITEGPNDDYTELLITLPHISDSGVSQHFKGYNTLMHIRFNTRRDKDGVSTLYIEEFQSDWHQQGRESGYKNPAKVAEYEQLVSEILEARETKLDKAMEDIQRKVADGSIFIEPDVGYYIQKFEPEQKEFTRLTWMRDGVGEREKWQVVGKEKDGATYYVTVFEPLDVVKKFLTPEQIAEMTSGSPSGDFTDSKAKVEDGATYRLVYKEGEDKDRITSKMSNIGTVIREMAGRIVKDDPEMEAFAEKLNVARKAQGKIPNAPFNDVNKYVELGMKRMITWAALNGHKRIAWTPGEVQTERYSSLLQREVSKIEVHPEGEDIWVSVYSGVGRNVSDFIAQQLGDEAETRKMGGEQGTSGSFDSKTTFVKMSPDNMSKVFGKGVSDLIIAKAQEPFEPSQPATSIPNDAIKPYVSGSGNNMARVTLPDGTIYTANAEELDGLDPNDSAVLDEWNKALEKTRGNFRSLQGLDLTIHDKGMIEVYNKIVRNVASKIVKKFGVSISTTGIDTGKSKHTVKDSEDGMPPFSLLERDLAYLEWKLDKGEEDWLTKNPGHHFVSMYDRTGQLADKGYITRDEQRLYDALTKIVPGVRESLEEDTVDMSGDKAKPLLEMGKVPAQPSMDAALKKFIEDSVDAENDYKVTPYFRSVYGIGIEKNKDFMETFAFDINDKMRESIHEGFPLFQRERGFMSTPGAPFTSQDFEARLKKVIFGFTDRANQTTMPHELSHFGVAMHRHFAQLAAQQMKEGNTDPEVKRIFDDWEALKSYVGATDDVFTREQEEKVATAFEDYMLRGVAPSEDLRAIFARFRTWFVNIFGDLKRSGVDVNPKISEVFDRWFASEQEIEKVQGKTATIADIAAALGLPPDVITKIGDYVAAATNAAEDKLYKELTAEQKAKQTQAYTDEFEKVRKEVIAELKTERQYSLMDYMRENGMKFLNGPELEGVPSDLLTEEDEHVHPDDVASLFGYASGMEMLRHLKKHPSLDRAADNETRRRLQGKYPDMIKSGQIKQRASSLIMNDKVVLALDLLIAELGKVNGANSKTSMKHLAKLIAQQRIEKMLATESDNIHRFEVQRDKSMREALKASRAGDPQAAMLHLQKALVNQSVIKGLEEFNETKQKAKDLFAKVNRKDKKLAPGHDIDFVGAARYILSKFGMVSQERFDINKFKAEIMTLDPDMMQDLIGLAAAEQTDAKPEAELTIPEFLSVYDAVENIMHTARQQKEFFLGERRMKAEVAEAELVAQMGADLPKLSSSTQVTGLSKIRVAAYAFKAALRRMEHWCKAMDGGDKGPFTKYIFAPAKRAEDNYKKAKTEWLGGYHKILKEHKKLLSRRTKISTGLFKTDTLGRMEELVFNDDLEMVGFLLHTGNESNLDKLLGGYGINDRAMFMQAIRSLENSNVLTEEHWQLVQKLWNHVEDLKPHLQRAHKKLYGFRFEEIDASPVESKHGTFRGGYWPAVVDPVQSPNNKSLEQLMEQTRQYLLSTTNKGFTMQRVDGYRQPLLTDLRLGSTHIDKVLRFIHLEPAARDITRITNRQAFKAKLLALDPDAHEGLIQSFIMRFVTQATEPPVVAGDRGAKMSRSIINKLRSRTIAQIIQYNPVVAVQNIANLSIAGHLVGYGRMAKAFATMTASPSRTVKDMMAMSPQMHDRLTTNATKISQEIDQIADRAGKFTKTKDFMTRHGFIFMRAMDTYLSSVVWTAAFNKEMAESGDHQQAVDRADSVIRSVMGSTNATDVSKIEAATPAIKAIMPFYSYFNAQANLITTEFGNIMRKEGWAGTPKMFFTFVSLVAIPAIVGQLIVDTLRGKMPDDDDDDGEVLDDWLAWAGFSTLKYLGATVPVVGQTVNAVINATNKNPMDDRLSISPIVSAGDNAIRTAKNLYKYSQGDKVDDAVLLRDVMSTMGFITGLPLGQIGKSAGYLRAVQNGTADPENAAEFAAGVLAGKPQKK